MLALLREGDSEPATLVAALRRLRDCSMRGEELAGHRGAGAGGGG